MPTLDDDIKIIQTAVYGKDMRHAITDALTKSWDSVLAMVEAVENLNKRVDNLSGGDIDPDAPILSFNDVPILAIRGIETVLEFAGPPELL